MFLLRRLFTVAPRAGEIELKLLRECDEVPVFTAVLQV